MTKSFLQSTLAVGMVLRLAIGLALNVAVGQEFAVAAVPAIGVVLTSGAFRLNHATVRSNATLFEGAMVETGSARARIDLASGTRLELESESAGRVLGGHLLLERGAARIEKALGSGFLVEARALMIQPDVSLSSARIVLRGEARVEVAVLTGSFRVLNSKGLLVAKIAAGNALALEAQSAAGPVRVTGRLARRGGHYLLKDETTNVTVEVSDSAIARPGLPSALGQRVEITGVARPNAMPVNSAMQLIEVAQVTPAPPASGGAPSGSGGTGGTAPAGAGGSAGGAASGAAISGTMIAVIGGVAIAAVVGGLAASGNLGASTADPISR